MAVGVAEMVPRPPSLITNELLFDAAVTAAGALAEHVPFAGSKTFPAFSQLFCANFEGSQQFPDESFT